MPMIPYSYEVAGVKLVGYSIAGYFLRLVYKSRFNPFLFGAIRFLTGTVVFVLGFIVLATVFKSDDQNLSFYIYYTYLGGVRFIVWFFLLAIIYESKNQDKELWPSKYRLLFYTFAGLLWSFALDGIVFLIRKKFPDFGMSAWC